MLFITFNYKYLNPIQSRIFRGCSQMGGVGVVKSTTTLPKMSYTYLAMMKLPTVIHYLKKIQKYINHVKQPLSSAGINIFSPEIEKFCYIKKYRYRLHFYT